MSNQEIVNNNKTYITEALLKGERMRHIASKLKINVYFISMFAYDNNIKLNDRVLFSKTLLDCLIPKMEKLFKEGHSAYEIAEILGGCSRNSVATRLKKLGYDISEKRKWQIDKLENHKNEIITLYLSGWSSIKIAKKFECTKAPILNLLNRHGIKRRIHRLYSVNHNFFEKIDTQMKAYILGLWYSDGNVRRKGTMISIGMCDFEAIDKIKECLEYTGPSFDIQREGRKLIRRLHISSKKLREDLIKLGCVPKKSLILTFPSYDQVPKELMNHFIRGVLDGDGGTNWCNKTKYRSNGYYKTQITGTLNVMTGIMNEAISTGISNKCMGVYTKKSYKNTWYFVVGSRRCIPFLDWIYKDSEFHLERKYQNYLKAKEYYK